MVDRTLTSGDGREGDDVVIVAGVPVGVRGSTNLLRVHTLGDV